MTTYAEQLTVHLDAIDAEYAAAGNWPRTVRRPEEVIEEDGYLTVVWYVGHAGWDGRQPRPDEHGIGHLLWMLTEYTLDPRFEAYGDFVQRDPQWLEKLAWRPPGTASIGGNFYDYSCAFSVESNHRELLDLLEQAVRRNQATPAYQAAKAELAAAEAAKQAERDREAEARQLASAAAKATYDQTMRENGYR